MKTNTNIKENINRLLETDMDRAGFLKICGAAILASIGVSGVLNALARTQPQQRTPRALEAGAYGGKNFGA